MRVFVYVEGPADRLALEKLLAPVLTLADKNRVAVRFFPLKGKTAVINDGPRNAARGLRDEPTDWYVLLPDLYPMVREQTRDDSHVTAKELYALLGKRFRRHADEVGLGGDVRSRFRVHCLKHDLEALVLAAPEALRWRLRAKEALKGHWRLPPEDQDGARPPKRVVEELFLKYRRTRYRDTTDAPLILERAQLASVEEACRQCFKPFVDDLRRIVSGKVDS